MLPVPFGLPPVNSAVFAKKAARPNDQSVASGILTSLEKNIQRLFSLEIPRARIDN